ncbi:MAG TPA: choice-of-anchor Q domain-containing protein [Polyangiaceae bacterium]
MLEARSSGVVIRQTCAGERVIDVLGPGSLTLRGVTVTGGALVGTDPESPALGGGVRARGDVVLESATITGNSATAVNGVPATAAGIPVHGGAARGGGLYVEGSLFGTDSVISDNHAFGGSGTEPSTPDGARALGGVAEGGGAYFGRDAVLVRGTLTNNEVRAGYAALARGGALASSDTAAGTVHISGAAFSSNVARGGGGTLADRVVVTPAGGARGGALAARGAVTLVDATMTSNVAGGGDMTEGPCTIVNPNYPQANLCQLMPSPAGGSAEGAALWTNGDLTIQGGSYAQQRNEGGRGAPQTIFVGSFVRTYYSRGPAGPTFHAGGAARLESAEFIENTGAVSLGPPGAGPAELLAAGRGTLQQVTLLRNGGGITVAGDLVLRDVESILSGGVRAAAVDAERVTLAKLPNAITATDHVSLVNSTVEVAGDGYAIQAGSVSLSHATIVGATWTPSDVLETTLLTTYNSLVLAAAGHRACAEGAVVEASAYNWFSDATCGLSGPGDRQERAAFLLQELAENGSALSTRVPGPGSVLIDAIPSSACSPGPDQRGVSRPQGTGCDIGAVEVVPATGTGPSDLALDFTPLPSVEYGGSITWELNLSNNGPNASTATVVIDEPSELVVVETMTATHGGVCHREYWGHELRGRMLCFWNTPLPPGARASVAMTGYTAIGDPPVVRFNARVFAPALVGDASDDTASVATTLVEPPPPGDG